MINRNFILSDMPMYDPYEFDLFARNNALMIIASFIMIVVTLIITSYIILLKIKKRKEKEKNEVHTESVSGINNNDFNRSDSSDNTENER